MNASEMVGRDSSYSILEADADPSEKKMEQKVVRLSDDS